MKATFLSRYTPSLMNPDDLEALFVQREELASRIIDLIRESALTESKHHTLLIGPRGIGKTHLVALTYYRVRKLDDLRGRLLIAWLREEEWGVTSFRDLLIRIFRALLAEDYNTELDKTSLQERIELLFSLQPKAAERAGAALLKEYVGNRTLLILVENLDDMFKGLADEGQKRLRSYLQENPFCTILATSQGLFNGVSNRTSPFYGFFRNYHLEELTIEDAIRLLTRIADLEGNTELASFIQSPSGRARIRALQHLVGGNHRVYVIFSQFLTRDSLDELVEPMMRTLDDLTPYYQARMAWLSPQQRKIVEYLCEHRGAVSVKEIARRCFLTHQTTSGQLKGLREMGYVNSTMVGRESCYELREPLMRLCIEVKKHRGEPVRLFVDFLRLWYPRAELQKRLESFSSDNTLERECFLHALHLAEVETEDPRVAACLKFLNDYVESGDFPQALEVAEELVAIRGDAADWQEKAHCLGHLNRFDEALEAVDRAIELDQNYTKAWNTRGSVLRSLNRYAEALESWDKTLEPNRNNARYWWNRGVLLMELYRYEDALLSFDKVIELNRSREPEASDAWLWNARGASLGFLGRHEEALASFKKVVELDAENVSGFSNQSIALFNLNRYEEALASLDEAIKLKPNSSSLWADKGTALNNLRRYDEALVNFEKAFQLGLQSLCISFNRIETLFLLNRWSEGETALDDALDLYAQDDEHVAKHTSPIVSGLLTSMQLKTWRARIKMLIELYDKHKVISALGASLVRSVPTLDELSVSNNMALSWLELWQELAGDRTEFQIPLRLLKAAVNYRETKDPRILLELPIEERKLLEPLLEMEQAEA
jgi:tetratricopeptide (TPR) repeat protein